MIDRRIAITAVGGIFPGASTISSFWDFVEQGRSAACEPEPGRWAIPLEVAYRAGPPAADKVYSRRACFLDSSFKSNSPAELDPFDDGVKLAVAAASQTFDKFDLGTCDPRRFGICIGNIALPTVGSSRWSRRVLWPQIAERFGVASPATPDANPLDRYVTSLPAGMIAKKFDLRGGVRTIDAACASSLYAIKLAIDDLLEGRADAMLAGGMAKPDSLYTQMGFCQLHALSPSGTCRPFDAQADGLVVGEGACFFVLERLADAIKRKRDILGVIHGVGLSNDVGGNILAPDSEGQLRALRSAYANADWRPSDVSMIECHATGTPTGDRVELASLAQLWKDQRFGDPCVLGSVKSNVGHLLTGAGAAGLAKVLGSFARRRRFPTANFGRMISTPHSESPFEVLSESQDWHAPKDGGPRRAAVSAFGFGGINAHLLVEEWRETGTGTTFQTAAVPREPLDVAIVGVGVRVGEWIGKESFAARTLFGIGRDLADCDRECRTFDIPVGRFPIPPKELSDMLPQQTLMLQAVDEAWREAGCDAIRPEDRKRIGGYFGVSLDLNTTNFDLRWSMREFVNASGGDVDQLREGVFPPLTSDRTLGALGGVVASRIARVYKLGGPNFTLSCEEASGIAALDAAVRALHRGEIDLAIVGAVDLPTDPRVVASDRELNSPANTLFSDGAVAFILKRTADAERDGDFQYGIVRGVSGASDESAAINAAVFESGAKADSTSSFDPTGFVGRTGAAAGLTTPLQNVLALAGRLRPATALNESAVPWLNNRADGPRSSLVSSSSVDESSWACVFEEASSSSPIPHFLKPPDAADEILLTFEAPNRESLEDLIRGCELSESASFDRTTRMFVADGTVRHDWLRLATVVARGDVASRLASLAESLKSYASIGVDSYLSSHSRNETSELAFVFAGSGAQFSGMGRDWALAFPDILDDLDQSETRLRDQFPVDAFWEESSIRRDEPLAVIQGQVFVGRLLTKILERFNIRPNATLGYSLGESAALFATGAWSGSDEMHRSLRASPLFQSELAGECRTARRYWNLPEDAPIDWLTAVVKRPADAVRCALEGIDRAYLLFINAPRQCVLGGDRTAVLKAIERLGSPFAEVRGVSTVHCEIAELVREEYFDLHVLPTKAPAGIRTYSAAWGEAFIPDEQSAAKSITDLSLGTIDFPRVVERAYNDGVRVFLDVGPGLSCSRMIDAILKDRPHRCIPICVEVVPAESALKRALAALWVEGFEPNLEALNERRPKSNASAGRTIRVEPSRLKFLDGHSLMNAAPTTHLEAPAPQPQRERTPLAEPVLSMNYPSATLAFSSSAASSDALVAQWTATQDSVSNAHSAFLSLQTATLDRWRRLLEQTENGGGIATIEIDDQPPRFTPTPPAEPPRYLDRDQCLAFAVGEISNVLGTKYAEIDGFPTRVRLPDEPLMLVDRILEIEGEPLSMSPGRVVTEHDVLPNAWYLDGGRIPTCIAVESGQADLFLSGYLGIDLKTRGHAMYRLLDAVVAFHGPLPTAGKTIRYDIRIERFFEHAGSQFFRFNFDAMVDGERFMTMREGCAGFFTPEALAAGKGVVRTAIDSKPRPGKTPADWKPLVEFERGSITESQVEALRNGDLVLAFGESFADLPIERPATIPGGRMRLVHRVPLIDPKGGRYGLGMIRGEADVHPDDWFLTCHFIDDRVMPGTLMYECCLHTLRVLLLRMGWVAEEGEVVYEPIPEISSRLKCRGQVIESTKTAWYEVEIKEIGFNPAPYVIADALMFADGRPIVEMTDMSLQLSGQTRESLESVWKSKGSAVAKSQTKVYDNESILQFAIGKPSLAFGDRYKVFDSERVIARLPGPPYKFLDRVVEVVGDPWVMKAGAACTAEYDVPPNEWYFDANRGGPMPFAVLLEIALQPCGWLAAYVGSALTSNDDLSFRNLGGRGVQHRVVDRNSGLLRTRVKMTNVSSSGGMVIQHFDFDVRSQAGPVYSGETYFGFFTKQALANQIGVREAVPYQPSEEERKRAKSSPFPRTPPFPDDRLRMMDDVAVHIADGGPQRLGFIEGRKKVRPDEWFFKAHFHQDPVWPGSLGLEAMVQLMAATAADRWGEPASFQALMPGFEHRWVYRGQVLPTADEVVVQATTTKIDDGRRILTADGLLGVDGRTIYQMFDFTVGWNQT